MKIEISGTHPHDTKIKLNGKTPGKELYTSVQFDIASPSDRPHVVLGIIPETVIIGEIDADIVLQVGDRKFKVLEEVV